MSKLSVKAIRVNMGMTQEELAIELGVTRESYNRKENSNNFSWDEIKIISKLSGVKPSDIQ